MRRMWVVLVLLLAAGVLASGAPLAVAGLGNSPCSVECNPFPPDSCCDCRYDWDDAEQRFCKTCYDTAAPRFVDCDSSASFCPSQWDCHPT